MLLFTVADNFFAKFTETVALAVTLVNKAIQCRGMLLQVRAAMYILDLITPSLTVWHSFRQKHST